jgi:DNA topoisomerase-1
MVIFFYLSSQFPPKMIGMTDMGWRLGRFGKFLACSGFPDCKNTKPYVSEELGKCPKCGKGFVVQKKTKNRRVFYGCSEYPNCDWAAWKKPNGEVKTN